MFKPFVQSLFVDLADEPATPRPPIHLGFQPAATLCSTSWTNLPAAASITSSLT
jgi:hypothetical protein